MSILDVFDFSSVFNYWTKVIAGTSGRQTYVDEHVRALPSQRVLDIGCGTGEILKYLPNVDYTGYDLNPRYIEYAKNNFADRGRFYVGDIDMLQVEAGSFDLVLATGVLHHLPDQLAHKLLSVAHSALRIGGRLITYDGCYAAKQPLISKVLLNLDRGKFVRNKLQYSQLIESHFHEPSCTIRSDLLKLPYTLAIFEAIKRT